MARITISIMPNIYRVARSVTPLLHLNYVLLTLAILLLIAFFFKIMSSPLLHPLRAFLLHRLHNTLRFVLLSTVTLGLAGFLCNTIVMEHYRPLDVAGAEDSASFRCKKLEKKRKKDVKRDKAGSKVIMSSTPCSSCDQWKAGEGASYFLIADQLIGTWLFESGISSSELEEGINIELDEGLAANYIGRGSAVSDAPYPSSQVHDGIKSYTRSSSNHSRSRSYTSGLSGLQYIDHQLQSDPADAAAPAASPSSSSKALSEPTVSNRRKASLSCDFGSTESPWLINVENSHADLHSPPLPPLESVVSLTENASEGQLERRSRDLIRRSLAPWRHLPAAPAPGRNISPASRRLDVSDKDQMELRPNSAKAPKASRTLANSDNTARRDARDELREEADAFIARLHEQWKLQRMQSLRRLSQSPSH